MALFFGPFRPLQKIFKSTFLKQLFGYFHPTVAKFGSELKKAGKIELKIFGTFFGPFCPLEKIFKNSFLKLLFEYFNPVLAKFGSGDHIIEKKIFENFEKFWHLFWAL